MYDILGKKVRRLEGMGKAYNLRINGLKPGVYLVNVNDKKGNIKREKISII